MANPHPLRVLVCPSGFKGSIKPWQVANSIEAGLRSVTGDLRVRKVPLVDGGEGFVDAVMQATGGDRHRATVRGPIGDRDVEATFGTFDMLFSGQDSRNQPQVQPGQDKNAQIQTVDGTRLPAPPTPWRVKKTAVIEMCSAAGFSLVPPDERSPLTATTWGVGQLILEAMNVGAQHIIVGCGDSATCDGGAGMLQALGAQLFGCFRSDVRRRLPDAAGASSLVRLERIDLGTLDPRIRNGSVTFEAVVNLESRLYGPGSTAMRYARQKGASQYDTTVVERAMERVAGAMCALYGGLLSAEQVREMPGAGASGGLGAGLLMLGAQPTNRWDIMRKFFPHLEPLLRSADVVFTGEGCLDEQSAYGKVTGMVAEQVHRLHSQRQQQRQQQHGGGVSLPPPPVVAIAGSLGNGVERNLGSYTRAGMAAYTSVLQVPCELEDAMEESEAMRLTMEAAAQALRFILAGFSASRARWVKKQLRERSHPLPATQEELVEAQLWV